MVVYVSPTQALVNQVTATIYGRFGHKTCPPGRTVCGAYTRDYWLNVDSCQVIHEINSCQPILTCQICLLILIHYIGAGNCASACLKSC